MRGVITVRFYWDADAAVLGFSYSIGYKLQSHFGGVIFCVVGLRAILAYFLCIRYYNKGCYSYLYIKAQCAGGWFE